MSLLPVQPIQPIQPIQVKVFKSPKEQETGVLKEPSPLPNRLVYFFPNINQDSIFHTYGLKEKILIVYLDFLFQIIDLKILEPNEITMPPRNTKHAVELSITAPRILNYEALKSYL